MKLPPGITHFSGCIACPEDLHLSQLRNLRRCHLWMKLAVARSEAPVVTMAQLTHLYVDRGDSLKCLSAPRLSSLTINPIQQGPHPSSAQEFITRFLHRSRFESLSIGKVVFTLDTISRMFALEACSTISRLKLELQPRMIHGIVKALTSPSVLSNLHHLILCISQRLKDEWAAIIGMVRFRRDAGLLKVVEVQFKEERYEYLWDEDMRGLTGDDFEMRVEEWDPPGRDVYLWYLP
ncbi:hypothetical protein EDD85DRAFT_103919 [Armillaria nabsnona]|nr:hypothetical protein EDD85DRAFT_103919 [Armillaria nabsnona]